MKTTKVTIRGLAIGLLLLLVTAAARADWVERSDENALMVLRSQAGFEPEYIAATGLSEFDADIVDLRTGVVARRDASDQQLIAELEKRLQHEQDTRVRQDLEILIKSLQDGIISRDLEERYLLPYYNVHGLLFYSFNSLLDPRNDKERYASALQRLRKYNGSEEGYSPITDLARARSTERFGVAGLLGPYRRNLETDLADSQTYVEGIRALLEQSGVAGWEKDFALLQQQLAAYEDWLRQEMLPRAREQSQLPEAIYADNLKTFGVRATPGELIETGMYAYQSLRSQMKALAWRIAESRGWKDRNLVPVIRRLKQEQIPPEDILAVYQQRLAQIEEIILREGIISLPERPASIRLATEAESAAIPAPFMRQPQLVDNTGQFGEFVLVQRNPGLEGDAQMDDWSHDAMTWALTTHEARAGHELQFASLVENGTSLARAVFAFNSANVEGWALYAESIMQEYLPLEAQLFILYTRAMRAARMFLDPMVNTGQMTREQAAEFLMSQLALSKPMALSEADRYAFRTPGQATSYYYGYMNLMRLRTEIEILMGEAFDQRAFHDYLIQQGLLPPEVMRQAVLEHFAGKQEG